MNKKILSICLAIGLMMLLPGKLITKAYAQGKSVLSWFIDSDVAINNLNIADIDVNIKEDFNPPSNWDGSANKKLVKIQNNSTGPALIRVSIQKRWENSDGTSWAGNTSFINLNFSNNEDNLWINVNDGYFYYNYILEKE